MTIVTFPQKESIQVVVLLLYPWFLHCLQPVVIIAAEGAETMQVVQRRREELYPP